MNNKYDYKSLLAQLTFSQKLALMESVWDDLYKAERYDSPSWHEALLNDRKKALEAGKLSISDWSEAKERIREKVRCGSK